MLVNVEHIISVRTALNGRLYARMENGEENMDLNDNREITWKNIILA